MAALGWAAVGVATGIALVHVDPWLGLLMLVIGVLGRWLLLELTGWAFRFPVTRYAAAAGVATVAAASMRSSASLDDVTGAWWAALLFFLAVTRTAPLVEPPVSLPSDVERLIVQAEQHSHGGDPGLAIPLYRQALDHAELQGRRRGQVAAALGWLLLGNQPSDPVPAESRHALGEATRHAPSHVTTLMLGSYFAVHDGQPKKALLLADRGLVVREHPVARAQLRCLKSAALADLGRRAEAARVRAEAEQAWPECDLLPWLDARTVP